MFGVITRRAVVEGSAPPAEERYLHDTVAYTGVVPIKVRKISTIGCDTSGRGARSGDVLAPSGREDGTAVLVPAGTSACANTPRVGIVLDACNLDATKQQQQQQQQEEEEEETQLVMSVVVPPSETGRQSNSIRMLWVCIALFMFTLVLMVCGAIWRAAPYPPPASSTPPAPQIDRGSPSLIDTTGDVRCSDKEQKLVVTVQAGVHSAFNWAHSSASNATLRGLEWQVTIPGPHHKTYSVRNWADLPDVQEFRGAFCAQPDECYNIDVTPTDSAFDEMMQIIAAKVRKMPFFGAIFTFNRNDQFAKTGSGQTNGKAEKKRGVFCRWVLIRRKGLIPKSSSMRTNSNCRPVCGAGVSCGRFRFCPPTANR
eukprot:COSAG06_NODE_1932_length_8039_cov_5.660327_4_plen_369_part_00